ncbi:hypothetical protein GH733_000607, partial [Mirounga leonina]
MAKILLINIFTTIIFLEAFHSPYMPELCTEEATQFDTNAYIDFDSPAIPKRSNRNCLSQLIPRYCSPGHILYGSTFLLHIINRSIIHHHRKICSLIPIIFYKLHSQLSWAKILFTIIVIGANECPDITLTVQMHAQHETLCHLSISCTHKPPPNKSNNLNTYTDKPILWAVLRNLWVKITIPLIPILAIIKTISLFIQPRALAVWLTTSITAEHLLIHLIVGGSLAFMKISLTIALFTFITLNSTILEFTVGLIQAYIFTLLFPLGFYHLSLAPTPELGSCRPHTDIHPLNPLEVLLLNTFVLLALEYIYHLSPLQPNRRKSQTQTSSPIHYSFHGLHVITGSTFLIVCFLLQLKFHFTSNYHFKLILTFCRCGSAHLPFSIKFFLVAITFLLFDLEMLFFYLYLHCPKQPKNHTYHGINISLPAI